MGSTLSKTGEEYTYCKLKNFNDQGNMYVFVKKKVYNIKPLYDSGKHSGSSEVLKKQTDKFIDQERNMSFHAPRARNKLNDYFVGYVSKCDRVCKVCHQINKTPN